MPKSNSKKKKKKNLQKRRANSGVATGGIFCSAFFKISIILSGEEFFVISSSESIPKAEDYNRKLE